MTQDRKLLVTLRTADLFPQPKQAPLRFMATLGTHTWITLVPSLLLLKGAELPARMNGERKELVTRDPCLVKLEEGENGEVRRGEVREKLWKET